MRRRARGCRRKSRPSSSSAAATASLPSSPTRRRSMTKRQRRDRRLLPARLSRGRAQGGGVIEPLAADAPAARTAFARRPEDRRRTDWRDAEPDHRSRSARPHRARTALSALVLIGAGAAYSQRATLEPMIVNYWHTNASPTRATSCWRRRPEPRFRIAARIAALSRDGRRARRPLPDRALRPTIPTATVHPQRRISGGRFAVLARRVTFNEWAVCVAAGHCPGVSLSGRRHGIRRAARRKHHMARCADLCRLALADNWADLSPPEQSGMGVHSAGRLDNAVFMGRRTPDMGQSKRAMAPRPPTAIATSKAPWKSALFLLMRSAFTTCTATLAEWVRDCYGAYNRQQRDADGR